MSEIINRVAKSGIVTINLEKYLPESEIVAFDVKQYLFKGLMLREKEYRAALKELDWEQYSGKHVAIGCSADAIVPIWAYMLAGRYLTDHAASYAFASVEQLQDSLVRENLSALDLEALEDKRVVIKGCGSIPIPASAYVEITRLLMPVVKTLMYGEPCSMVPLYKKPK